MAILAGVVLVVGLLAWPVRSASGLSTDGTIRTELAYVGNQVVDSTPDPTPLGTVTASRSSWAPGDEVTITVTISYPIQRCTGFLGDYITGPTAAIITWPHATHVGGRQSSYDEDGFTFSAGTGSASWQSPKAGATSPGQPEDYLSGSYSATFVAPSIPPDSVDPSIFVPTGTIHAGALDPAFHCNPQSTQGLPVRTLQGSSLPSGAEQSAPIAGFSFTASPTDARTIAFTNTSSDAEDSIDSLVFDWDFGDGSTHSTERDPVHRYASGGSFVVTLKVTDTAGDSATRTAEVVIDNGLVVNSTGDGGAVDVDARGCDTGATVGDAPECTLRAAIETANARGGGEITFAIDGGGVPVIAPGSLLPTVSASTVIDGTSQPGGFVKLDGGGTVNSALVLSGGTSKVSGVVVDRFDLGIVIGGGSGHIISGNRFGTDQHELPFAVLGTVPEGGTGATGVVVEGNELVCTTCVKLTGGTGSRVKDNAFGVALDGRTATVPVDVAVWLSEASADVSGNTVAASKLAVLVEGPGAAGSSVEDNYVGAGRDGQRTTQPAVAVRVDAAPAVSVTNNVLTAKGDAAVQITGSDQLVGTDPLPPFEEQEGPVTGGATTVVGNTIGLLPDQITPPPGVVSATDGVSVWAGASGVRIDDNVIAFQRRSGISLKGGSGHRVVDNTLGTDPSGGAEIEQASGILLADTKDAVIGASGVGNLIRATDVGVLVTGSTTGTQVVGNDIGRSQLGIGVEGDAVGEVGGSTVAGTSVSGNTIEVTGSGVVVSGSVTGAVVRENTITGGETGILVEEGPVGTEAIGNTLVGAQRGLLNAAAGTSISSNLVGIDQSGTVSGNSVAGIGVDADATVDDNVVVGNTGFGIVVGADAVGTLSGNRIYDTDGIPLSTLSGPVAPEVTAAIRTSGSGEEDRTVLVVAGLPEAGVGKVEVFANDDCSDPEARYALGVSFAKVAGRSYALVPLIGRGDRDAFTVTYTDALTGTSALSGCEARGTYPDSDGDGSVDPIEDLGGTADDASTATVVTDTGVLVQVAATEGTLSGVGFVEDPAPGAHPGGFSLPYGVLGFVVEGLDRGASTQVAVGAVDGTDLSADAYWKYGPASPGAAPSWFAFDADEESGTGAELTTVDLGDSGFTRAWVLSLTDGARGDSDGSTDGRIVDPGGPALVPILPGTPEPTDPTDPTTPTDPGSGTGAGTLDGVVTLTIPAAGPADAAAVDGTLPYTGSDDGYLLVLGAVLLTAGALTVGVTRRRRRA